MYRLAKCLAAILCAACLLTAAGASAGAERSPRIVLMCCYQQEGWGDGSSATFLDEAGCIWRYESAEPLPDTDSARLALLAEAESVVAAGQIELWRMLELISLIEAVQPGPLEPQAAVAADYGLNTFSAVRYGADGSAEVIPLAISGDQVAENLEPNAYALYVALFYEVMSHDAAEHGCSPGTSRASRWRRSAAWTRPRSRARHSPYRIAIRSRASASLRSMRTRCGISWIGSPAWS